MKEKKKRLISDSSDDEEEAERDHAGKTIGKNGAQPSDPQNNAVKSGFKLVTFVED